MRFKHFRSRLKALWRELKRLGEYRRSVLAVTPLSSLQMDLHVFSIEHGWHLVLAETLEAAVERRMEMQNAVVLYDRDLPGVQWRHGLKTILACSGPACVILLSREVESGLRRTTLECGGYDVARKPFEYETLTRLVNGAFVLAESVDSITLQRDHTRFAAVA